MRSPRCSCWRRNDAPELCASCFTDRRDTTHGHPPGAKGSATVRTPIKAKVCPRPNQAGSGTRGHEWRGTATRALGPPHELQPQECFVESKSNQDEQRSKPRRTKRSHQKCGNPRGRNRRSRHNIRSRHSAAPLPRNTSDRRKGGLRVQQGESQT